MNSTFKHLIYTVMIVFLSACGGGSSTPEATTSITSFTSSSATITAGTSVNLTAVLTEGTATIDNGVGAVTSNTPVSVTPSTTTIYTLTATNVAGDTFTSTVTVTVIPAPTITSFTASTATITVGDSVNLTAVFVNGTGSINNGIGAVTSNVAKSVTPASTTTYTLTITNVAGTTVTSTVTVTVVAAPTITSFVTSSATIALGSSVDITAVFADGTASIDNSVGTVTSNVAKSVSPTSTSTYTLTVTNAAGTSVTSTVTITVVDLSSLSLVNGNLDQIFQSNQSTYTATVGYLASTIKVQATTVVAGAVIKVNNVTIGSDNYSQTIDLSVGANAAIIISVTKDAVTTSYTLTITRQSSGTLAQQAFIKATTPGATNLFGIGVSLSGDTLAVGEPQGEGVEANSGVVYIFVRSGSTWTLQAKLFASDGLANDGFAGRVSLSGDTLVVSAPNEDTTLAESGAIYVFTRSGTIWTQQAKLKTITPVANAAFGTYVALSGDTLAVSAYTEDTTQNNSGAVYIFTRNNSIWTQQAKLKASTPGLDNYFGYDISLEGDTLVVGAYAEDTTQNNSGAAYIFTRSDVTWTQQAMLKASTPGINESFGASVSIHGNTLAIGAHDESTTQTYSGAVYIFTGSGATWTQQTMLKASIPTSNDRFGGSVSLSGNTLAIGAYWDDTTQPDSGAVYIFTGSSSTWTQQAKLKAAAPATDDLFGRYISLSGDTLAVGAFKEDTTQTDSGASYIYK